MPKTIRKLFVNEFDNVIGLIVEKTNAGVSIDIWGPNSLITNDITDKEARQLCIALNEYFT